MKNLLFILFMFVSLQAFSQKTYNLDTIKAKTETSIKTEDVAIYKGVTYPIYKTKNNKYYIIRTSSKTGNTYKQYLTEVIKQ